MVLGLVGMYRDALFIADISAEMRERDARCTRRPRTTRRKEESATFRENPKTQKDLYPEVYYARKYEQALCVDNIYMRKSQPVAASLSFTASAAEYQIYYYCRLPCVVVQSCSKPRCPKRCIPRGTHTTQNTRQNARTSHRESVDGCHQ